MNRIKSVPPLQGAGQNLLLDYLDAIGMPWRMSIEDLKKRYGGWLFHMSRDPVIKIRTARPFMTGMKQHLTTRIDENVAPHLPATHFFCSVYHQPEARANFEHGYAELAAVLGKGESSVAANTIGSIWRFGASVCELTAWPPELQSDFGTNALHQREPWRESACNLTIHTGYLMPVSDAERADIAGFQEIARWLPQTDALPEPDPWRTPGGSEFVRNPEPDFAHCVGAIGTCPKGTSLIFFGTCLHLVKLADVESIEVERLRRAKGDAGSHLYIVVRRNGRAHAALHVCSAPGEDDLNDFSENLGARLGKPVSLFPYEYNC